MTNNLHCALLVIVKNYFDAYNAKHVVALVD